MVYNELRISPQVGILEDRFGAEYAVRPQAPTLSAKKSSRNPSFAEMYGRIGKNGLRYENHIIFFDKQITLLYIPTGSIISMQLLMNQNE